MEVEATRSNWTDTEMDLLRQVYPDGGTKGCMKVLPGKSLDAIRQAAVRYGIRRRFKPQPERKLRQSVSPYPWPPLSDLDRVALREWAYVDRTGQLRPIVKVELEAA